MRELKMETSLQMEGRRQGQYHGELLSVDFDVHVVTQQENFKKSRTKHEDEQGRYMNLAEGNQSQ